jgi:hypothetical protein
MTESALLSRSGQLEIECGRGRVFTCTDESFEYIHYSGATPAHRLPFEPARVVLLVQFYTPAYLRLGISPRAHKANIPTGCYTGRDVRVSGKEHVLFRGRTWKGATPIVEIHMQFAGHA